MIKKARLKIFIFFLVFLLIYVPCVQAVTPQCIQPPDAIAPAEFNPDTGYCETYPISSNGTCPENYVYSDTAGKCVSMPYCEGDYSYNFSTRQCEKISYTSPSSGEGFYLQEGVHYCAVDSNGNGDVEQNEIDECIQTEQGYLCPLGAVECSIQEKVATCPEGYTYNSTTGKCEYSPAVGVCQSRQVQVEGYQCPATGEVYSDLSTCNSNCLQVATCDVHYTCPSGSTYNSATGKCEVNSSQCPPGFQYGYGYGGDWLCSLGCYGDPICPPPGGNVGLGITEPYCAHSATCAYKGSSCVSPYTLCKNNYLLCAADPTGEGPWGKTCPNVEQGASSYWYDKFWDKCFYRPQPGYSCVPPYSPITLSVCIYNSHQCPAGSTWVDYCGCYAPPEQYCPSGYTYNPSTGKCEKNPTITYICPLGNYPCSGSPPTCQKGEACVTYSETVTRWKCSLDGKQYDTQEQCTSSCYDFCPSGGVYNPSTQKCELSPEFQCPEGTVELKDGRCAVCPYENGICMNNNGVWMCSPNKCFTAADIQNDEPDTIPNGYQDDGGVSEDGSCLGSIFIFNGYEMRCRPAGMQTGFQNCCDEAQGKIYDNTGSLSGSFTTVKNVIAAISASKQVAQISYYATKIASGEYALQATGTGVAELVNTATGEVVTTYATDSAEAIALAQVDTGMSANVAVQTAGTTYISQLKTDIALTIVNLAVSQVIDDPLVAATVNFAATLAVPYLFPGATISPVGLAFAAINIALSFFGGGCDEQDILTSTYKESGYCHYVGSKCLKKIPLVGCVQKAKVYCCFNSKLARIIHEQGRPQLANFQGNLWGSAKHPICRGFTPEEFQALDFSKMDLSEYYADIERNVTENLQQKVTTQINETYEGLR